MDFDGCARSALDIWSEEPVNAPSDTLITKVLSYTKAPGTRVLEYDLRADNPEEFTLRDIVENPLEIIDEDLPLGGYPDQTFIRGHVMDAYKEAKTTGHPIIDSVTSQVQGHFFIYDRIILPQKTTMGIPAQWALGIVCPRLLLPLPQARPSITEVESNILFHLMRGEQPKEIAPHLNLTRRAIEHRIQALKTKYRAKNVTHLVSLAITTGLVGPN